METYYSVLQCIIIIIICIFLLKWEIVNPAAEKPYDDEKKGFWYTDICCC